MSYFGTLYQEDLPPRAKTVYMYLKDRSNQDGVCWTGIKTIAKGYLPVCQYSEKSHSGFNPLWLSC